MFLELEFEELENAFDLELEQVTEISDGGFERGYAEGYAKGDADGQAKGRAEGEQIGYQSGYTQGNADGYTTGKTEGVTEGFADALAKRTELVVTDSGEYVPEGESTGFKKVTVGIQKGEDLDAVIAEQAELIGELSATLDEKIGAYDVGYDAALEKLTDLVVTENGEYTPSEGSTGFKTVSVNVQAKSDMDAFIEGSTTDISSVATSVIEDAFKGNTKLTSANFPNATSIGDSAFYNCTTLASGTFPKATSIANGAFYGCSTLTSLDFASATSIGANAFNNCKALKTFVLRSNTVCTLSNTNAFSNCPLIIGADKDGYIYIPSALIESYESATNWSYRAGKFRALEDYTVDGTINGALDPNKV